MSDKLSDSDYRELHRQVQEMALRAHPNPDRVGCPGAAALEEMATLPLSSAHPLFQEHVSRCSPCLAELLEIRGRNHRQRQFATRKWWIAVASLAAAAAVVVIVLLGMRSARLSTEAEVLRRQAIAQRERSQSLENKIAALSASRSAPPSAVQVPATILLRSGISRSAVSGKESNNVVVKSEPSFVILLLALPQDTYPQYDAVVEAMDGTQIRRVDGLLSQPIQNNGRAVVVSLPSQALPNGTYIVRLLGHGSTGGPETVDGYSFRVSR